MGKINSEVMIYMKINNIMTKNIVSLQSEDTIEHAAQLMKRAWSRIFTNL